MARQILDDKGSRESQMRAHVNSVAEAVLSDTTGDEEFSRLLAFYGKVHNYSFGNILLQHWQAPDSKLIASRTAFAQMAKEQGHQPVTRTVRGGARKGEKYEDYIFMAEGSKAVWIWGAPQARHSTVEVVDENGDKQKQVRTYLKFFPAKTFRVEDIRYADTGEPMQLPKISQSVEDVNLFDGLTAFCKAQGITVSEANTGQADGVSKGGEIVINTGFSWEETIPVLAHEIAHELIHPLQERAEISRKVKEAEAEATAAVILKHFGHGIGPQAAYLRNWEATPKDIIDSMERIATAAVKVIDFIEKAAAGPQETTGDDSSACGGIAPAELEKAA